MFCEMSDGYYHQGKKSATVLAMLLSANEFGRIQELVRGILEFIHQDQTVMIVVNPEVTAIFFSLILKLTWYSKRET
jgi:hypothetical protein